MITNTRNGRVLSSAERYCVSLWSRMRGLMFTSKAGGVQQLACVLVFSQEARVSLHMWFVPYPIDVVFLDRYRIVVELRKSFMPWTAFTSAQKSAFAVELAEGAISRAGLKLGDQLAFSTGEAGAYVHTHPSRAISGGEKIYKESKAKSNLASSKAAIALRKAGKGRKRGGRRV